MIVRAHFVLTTLLTGHLFTVDGLFLQYKSSSNKKSLSIQGIQNAQLLRLPRDIRKLLSNKKNVVILDRKDKRVKKFLQKLYNVIEDHSEKPVVLKQQTDPTDECYKAFGSIHNLKPDKKCKRKKPTVKVVKVNVIPVKKPFLDSTRKGSDAEYFSDDGKSSQIIRIKIVNGRRNEGNDENDEPEEVKARKLREHRFSLAKNDFNIAGAANKQDSTSEENILIGKTLKRFRVVKNVDKAKHTKYVSNKNLDESEDDSDDEAYQQKPQKETQKLQTTQATDDTADDDDSDEPWQKPQKQKSKDPQRQQLVPSDSESDDRQSKIKEANKPKDKKQKHADSSVESQNSLEDILKIKEKLKKHKREKNANKKYVYLQGNRVVNSDLESEETRRADRDLNTFLPKNKFWTSHETHHLSYYWYNGPQGHLIERDY